METKLLSTDRPIAIYYSFPENIESITGLDQNTKLITFKDGEDWKLINTTIGTIDLKEIPQATAGGTIYNNELNASCPGHEKDTPDHIAAITGRKLLIRLDFKGGLKKLIGNLESGPRLYIETSANTTTQRKIQSNWKSPRVNYWLA